MGKRDIRMPYKNMEWKGQLSVFPWELQTQVKVDVNLLVKLVLVSQSKIALSAEGILVSHFCSDIVYWHFQISPNNPKRPPAPKEAAMVFQAGLNLL